MLPVSREEGLSPSFELGEYGWKILYRMWRDLEIQSPRHFGEILWNAARMNLAYFI